MSKYLKADQRRKLAREAALAVLSRGQLGAEEMSLRHVAQEMDVPLSTLTYVYHSTSSLLVDLVIERDEAMWEDFAAQVGEGGLGEELRRVAQDYYTRALGDRSRVSLMLWEIQQVANRAWTHAEVDVHLARRLIDRIAERGREHYRVDHTVLAHLFLAFAYGQILHWAATEDDAVFWSTMLAAIDGLVLLADPRPLGVTHDETAPGDYTHSRLPTGQS